MNRYIRRLKKTGFYTQQELDCIADLPVEVLKDSIKKQKEDRSRYSSRQIAEGRKKRIRKLVFGF